MAESLGLKSEIRVMTWIQLISYYPIGHMIHSRSRSLTFPSVNTSDQQSNFKTVIVLICHGNILAGFVGIQLAEDGDCSHASPLFYEAASYQTLRRSKQIMSAKASLKAAKAAIDEHKYEDAIKEARKVLEKDTKSYYA